MSLTLTVNDTGPTLTGTVSASLVGATARVLNVKRPDGTTFTSNAAAVDAANGTWSANLAAGDLDQAGRYYTELQVTFSDSSIQTFALDANGRETYFMVRDQIA